MCFSEALKALKQGMRMARAGWNGRGQYVEMQTPDEHSKMGEPYLFLRNTQLKLVPWVPSQGDLFGEDWIQAY